MPQNETDMQEVAGTKAERVAEQTRIRLGLLKNGYTPLANKNKMCVLDGWPGLKITKTLISDTWADQLRYTATGVRVDGRLVVLDFDIDDDDMLDAVYDALPDDLVDRVCDAPTRKGKGAKVAVFMRLADGEGTFGRIVSQAYAPPGSDQTCRLEVFGSGEARQFGAFGPHSHDDEGAVAVSYRWVDGLSLLDVPLDELPEISRAEVLEVCDAASWAMREGGWEYEVKSKSGVVESSVSFSLDDDMEFETRDYGVLGLGELEDLCSVVGEGVRLSAGWLEGDSAVNTSRCIARLNDGDGRLQIWESADCRLYRPRALDVHNVVGRLSERLGQASVASGAAEKVSAGAKGFEDGEVSGAGAEVVGADAPLDRWSALVAAAEEKGSVFADPSGAAGEVEDTRPAVSLLPGQLTRATDIVSEGLSSMPQMFNMGGRLVGVLDGTICAMTEPRLAYEIGHHFRCTGAKGKDVDPSPGLVKQVLSLVEESGYRALRGVVDMPVVDTDGAVVVDGYAPGAKLVVSDDLGVAERLSVADLSDAGIRAALETVWAPFSEFPFVGPLDRGGALACVLTAVCRSWLPTAPMFAFDAPVQGSGKSLLSRAIGALSGRYSLHAPLPLRDEDEMRKTLLTMLLDAPNCVVFDNQLGLVDSAVLGGMLTAETLNGRMLGGNTTIKAPTGVLVIVNGNNLAVGGVMPRRTLRVRIDPQMETPFERRFDFDPESAVRARRGDIAAAALVLILWGLEKAGQGRIGSFERWDQVVGQTVARVGRKLDDRFGDPAEVVRNMHADDPQRDDLGDLLDALRDEFGNKWFTGAEVVARMAGASGPLFEAFGYDRVPNSKAVGRHLAFRRDAKISGMTIQVSRDTNKKVNRFRVWSEEDAEDVVVAGGLEQRRAEQKAKLGSLAGKT